jgi:hypothetical protein
MAARPLGQVEAVHLRQHQVEGLLPLVVGDHSTQARPAVADRVDLVDEDDRGARLRASLNRSLTQAAPTPTNISTKLEPATEKNSRPRPALAASCRCRGPIISMPLGLWRRPAGSVRDGGGSHNLADLGLDSLVTGHVAELGRGRSASNTFARRLLTPSTPCRLAAPPLARAIRRNSQNTMTNGSSKNS